MTGLAITIKGLKKSYKKTEVLKDFDAGRDVLWRFWEKWEFISSKINELKEKK